MVTKLEEIIQVNNPTEINVSEYIQTESNPMISFDAMSGSKLIDELLLLTAPKLSRELIEFLKEPDELESLIDKVTLVKESQKVIVQSEERTILDDPDLIKMSLKVVGLLTKPSVVYKRFYQELEPRLIPALMRICQPNSRASFYHFKKLFIVCLSQCVSCLDILLTETDEFESNLFINLLYNVVNPPVQDCIISALIKLQDLQNDSLNAKLIDCQFAERLCEMILSNDVQVCSGAVVLFQRILINSRHDSNFFLDGLRGDSTSIQAIFMKCSDPAVPIAFKEQYISLFHSLVTCKLESVLDFAKSCLDSFQLLFPTIFIRTKFLEYSVSTQIKLLQVLVFYTRLDSRVLEFIDWDFFISGFFDRYKYSVLIRDCSMYLVYCYQLIAIAFEVAHQKSFEQFIELYLADDLISNMESRFANKPFVRMLLNLIVNQVQDLDSLFVKVVDMIPEWEKVQHKLLLEEQRLAAIVAKPVPVKTPILDCEGLPKVVPNDPI